MNLTTDFDGSPETRCVPDGQNHSRGADPQLLVRLIRTENPTARRWETQGRDGCEKPDGAQGAS